MEARNCQKERPLEFLTVYGITLLLAMAGTFYLKSSQGSALPVLTPASQLEVAESFASGSFSERKTEVSICSRWFRRFYPE